VLSPLVGATAVPGFGLVNLDEIHLWRMRRPFDANEFRREFQTRILRQ